MKGHGKMSTNSTESGERQGTVVRVSGPLVVARGLAGTKMYELVRIGNQAMMDLGATLCTRAAPGLTGWSACVWWVVQPGWANWGRASYFLRRSLARASAYSLS